MNKLLAVAGGSTLAYATLAVLMAVLPGAELSQVPPGPGVLPLTDIEAHGREVYISEGCAYCHTQQVRPLDTDRIFGRPSAPGDFAYDTPELLGSERNGPDLSNIGARQASDVWQYIHLYDPRAVVPLSIMPSFPWLFEVVDRAPAGAQPVPVPQPFAPAQGVVLPTEKAQALVAYLLALRQPKLPGAQAQPVAAPLPTAAPQAAAAATGTAGGSAAAAFDAAQGARLFAANCGACHGAQGAGIPGVFPDLVGDPVVTAADPAEHIATVLHGAQGRTIKGVKYAAAMPPFAATLTDAQIADIIDHERTSWGNKAPTVSAADVAAARAKQ